MYAVIEFQWHQYIVSQNTTIVVDRIEDNQDTDITIDSVLCVFNEEWSSVEVGAPYVKWATITAHVVSHQKGEKINVLKFHRKNRYERNKWFRPYQTTLTITGINTK